MADEPIWLPREGEKLLQKLYRLDSIGFFDNPQSGQIRGRPTPAGVLLGKPTSTVAQGSSGTFTIWSGTTKGSETATSATIEDVYCRASEITTTQMAYLQPVDSGWEAVPAECPE